MSQLRPELVDDARKAADLLGRATYVFAAHDGDPEKIRNRMTPDKKEEDDAHH